jgi:hypothetical protein
LGILALSIQFKTDLINLKQKNLPINEYQKEFQNIFIHYYSLGLPIPALKHLTYGLESL